jgi:hypothetical protein
MDEISLMWHVLLVPAWASNVREPICILQENIIPDLYRIVWRANNPVKDRPINVRQVNEWWAGYFENATIPLYKMVIMKMNFVLDKKPRRSCRSVSFVC